MNNTKRLNYLLRQMDVIIMVSLAVVKAFTTYVLSMAQYINSEMAITCVYMFVFSLIAAVGLLIKYCRVLKARKSNRTLLMISWNSIAVVTSWCGCVKYLIISAFII